MKLYVGTITSSSCLAPTASKDKWRAVVPEETAQAYLYPVFFFSISSKEFTYSPTDETKLVFMQFCKYFDSFPVKLECKEEYSSSLVFLSL